jgi:integrase
MALHLYRRHRRQCKGHHPEDSYSGEFDERQKGWRRCECPILLAGTLAGHFRRCPTETSDWDAARAVAVHRWEVAAWTASPPTPPAAPSPPLPPAAPTGGPVPVSAPPSPPRVTDGRMTLPAATHAFLTNREGRHLKNATLKKYRTFVKQISAFATTRGYRCVDEFTMADVDDFYAQWRLGPRTKGKRLATLRAFFRFCFHRKWVPDNPLSPDLKPPVGASTPANKAPFTDEEIDRIIRACDQVRAREPNGAARWRRVAIEAEDGPGQWTGEDLKDLIWLMLYTGYRISDASFFDMTCLRGNHVSVRATKNGADVLTYLPDWLCDRLRAHAARRGRQPFLYGPSRRLETVTNTWRRRLARVFSVAGPFEEPPTPHRFRHTFARLLLQKGVSIADVADLLGDDEKTVRRHYARWVPERQERLTQILKDALGDNEPPSPKGSEFSAGPPRLVVLQGGRR